MAEGIKKSRYLIILPVLLFLWYGFNSFVIGLYMLGEDSRRKADLWIMANIRERTVFGEVYDVKSQPHGFALSMPSLYSIKYLGYKCTALDGINPDYFVITEDRADPDYAFTLEEARKVEEFMRCLERRYRLERMFRTPPPLGWQIPRDVEYEIHPDVLLYKKVRDPEDLRKANPSYQW